MFTILLSILLQMTSTSSALPMYKKDTNRFDSQTEIQDKANESDNEFRSKPILTPTWCSNIVKKNNEYIKLSQDYVSKHPDESSTVRDEIGFFRSNVGRCLASMNHFYYAKKEFKLSIDDYNASNISTSDPESGLSTIKNRKAIIFISVPSSLLLGGYGFKNRISARQHISAGESFFSDKNVVDGNKEFEEAKKDIAISRALLIPSTLIATFDFYQMYKYFKYKNIE
jgi:hypothetical protein